MKLLCKINLHKYSKFENDDFKIGKVIFEQDKRVCAKCGLIQERRPTSAIVMSIIPTAKAYQYYKNNKE